MDCSIDEYVRRLLEAQNISEFHFKDELENIIEEVERDAQLGDEVLRFMQES